PIRDIDGSPAPDQLYRDRSPAENRGIVEGRVAGAVRRIQASPRLQQSPDRLRAADEDRRMEGRGADCGLGVEIGATLDQQLDHVEVRGGSAGQVQRGLTAAVPSLNVSPMREQQGGERRVAVEGGAMQGSFSLR